MTQIKGIGKTGMVLAAIAAGTMCVLSYLFGPESRLSGELGICLRSPNLWELPPLWSWAINTAGIALITIGAFLLNRHFNFIRSTQPVLPALFLVLTASNPWITGYLSTSTLVCAVNLMSLSVLFGCFKKRNATQEMFLIGTMISVGSMVQYAFIPYIIPYIIGAIVMKAFRLKEFLAMTMGILAPYWVGLGLGIIHPDWFRMPEITNLFRGFAAAPDLFILMASVGIASFFGVLLGLNNSIKLYAGNSRINALNMAVSLVGATSILCVIIDFSNMMAYIATLYFTVGVQVANLCALWHIRREWIVTAVPAVIYIGFFITVILI